MTLTEEQIKEIAEKHSSNDYVRSIAERCIREALELAEKQKNAYHDVEKYYRDTDEPEQKGT